MKVLATPKMVASTTLDPTNALRAARQVAHAQAVTVRHASMKVLATPKMVASTTLYPINVLRKAQVQTSVPTLIALHATNLAVMRSQVVSIT